MNKYYAAFNESGTISNVYLWDGVSELPSQIGPLIPVENLSEDQQKLITLTFAIVALDQNPET